ncbi:MAG TPA: transposase, partial [Thermosynechococcaceae cyanobacterium]
MERRWRRLLGNQRVRVSQMYVLLVRAALSAWSHYCLYLALDTTVLWNRYSMIHLSVVCCGRAVPLLWRVLEHDSP